MSNPYMHCRECQKETICQYGLLYGPDHDLAGEPLTFCSQKCMNVFLRARGYLSTSERRIAELEEQVADLQEQLSTK
jgi:hypothetical protein